MVHMLQPTPNGTAGEVVFVNVDVNKSDLTGTVMVLVAGIDGREH